MELFKMKIKTIKLIDHGSHLNSRVIGVEIRDDILNEIKKQDDLVIVINLEEVNSLSTGFCYELFGHLFLELKSNFSNRIRVEFKENKNKDLLKFSINNAIKTAINKDKNQST